MFPSPRSQSRSLSLTGMYLDSPRRAVLTRPSTTRIKLPMTTFLQPDYAGNPYLECPAFSFLIEHPNKKPILFDLGVRYDWQRLPSFEKFRENGWGVMVEKDVGRILKDHGVDVDGGAIGSIVWSHNHWVCALTSPLTTTDCYAGSHRRSKSVPKLHRDRGRPWLYSRTLAWLSRKPEYNNSGG